MKSQFHPSKPTNPPAQGIVSSVPLADSPLRGYSHRHQADRVKQAARTWSYWVLGDLPLRRRAFGMSELAVARGEIQRRATPCAKFVQSAWCRIRL
jgi:hypothetical protein